MADDTKRSGMKSAYELALERLEARGIEPPTAALPEATKQAIAEARRATQAKLAELEILHHDKLAKLEDFTQREEQEEYFRRERERITADGERAVAKLRESS